MGLNHVTRYLAGNGKADDKGLMRINCNLSKDPGVVDLTLSWGDVNKAPVGEEFTLRIDNSRRSVIHVLWNISRTAIVDMIFQMKGDIVRHILLLMVFC